MYQAHFGFRQSPFHLTPNVSLFQPLSPHAEALEMALAALSMNEGIVLISGEVGTGKTLLCRTLMSYLPESILPIYLPTPPCDAQELRHCVAKELDLPTDGSPSQVLHLIQMALIEQRMENKRVVVLVDEAQALSDDALEALRLLGNLETEDQKLLQLVLFAQPELDVRLSTHEWRQLQQRIGFRAQLRALDLSETVAYIGHRLNETQGHDALLSMRHRRAIWRASFGIPRVINQLCHKALLSAFVRRAHRVSHKDVATAIRHTPYANQPKGHFPCFWGWSK